MEAVAGSGAARERGDRRALAPTSQSSAGSSIWPQFKRRRRRFAGIWTISVPLIGCCAAIKMKALAVVVVVVVVMAANCRGTEEEQLRPVSGSFAALALSNEQHEAPMSMINGADWLELAVKQQSRDNITAASETVAADKGHKQLSAGRLGALAGESGEGLVKRPPEDPGKGRQSANWRLQRGGHRVQRASSGGDSDAGRGANKNLGLVGASGGLAVVAATVSATRQPRSSQAQGIGGAGNRGKVEQGNQVAPQEPEADQRRITELKQMYMTNRAISDHAYYTLLVIYSLFILVGTISNALICLTVILRPKILSPRNIFIVNLAGSDLLLCIFTMPFSFIEISTKMWQMGLIPCKLVAGLQATSIFVSTISITAIALDRYKVIVFPTHQEASNGARGPALLLALIWFGALLLSSPLFYFRTVEHHDLPHRYETIKSMDFCVEAWPYEHGRGIFSVITMLFQYVLPITIVSVVYAKISDKLQKRLIRRQRLTQLECQQKRQLHLIKRTHTMLISVSLIFGLSWLPLNLLNVIGDFSDIFRGDDQLFRIVFSICHLIGCSSACSNPILYGYLNENFRKEFKQVYTHYMHQMAHLIARICGFGHCGQSSDTYLPSTPTQTQSSLSRSSSDDFASDNDQSDAGDAKRFRAKGRGRTRSAIEASNEYDDEDEDENGDSYSSEDHTSGLASQSSGSSWSSSLGRSFKKGGKKRRKGRRMKGIKRNGKQLDCGGSSGNNSKQTTSSFQETLNNQCLKDSRSGRSGSCEETKVREQETDNRRISLQIGRQTLGRGIRMCLCVSDSSSLDSFGAENSRNQVNLGPLKGANYCSASDSRSGTTRQREPSEIGPTSGGRRRPSGRQMLAELRNFGGRQTRRRKRRKVAASGGDDDDEYDQDGDERPCDCRCHRRQPETEISGGNNSDRTNSNHLKGEQTASGAPVEQQDTRGGRERGQLEANWSSTRQPKAVPESLGGFGLPERVGRRVWLRFFAPNSANCGGRKREESGGGGRGKKLSGDLEANDANLVSVFAQSSSVESPARHQAASGNGEGRRREGGGGDELAEGGSKKKKQLAAAKTNRHCADCCGRKRGQVASGGKHEARRRRRHSRRRRRLGRAGDPLAGSGGASAVGRGAARAGSQAAKGLRCLLRRTNQEAQAENSHEKLANGQSRPHEGRIEGLELVETLSGPAPKARDSSKSSKAAATVADSKASQFAGKFYLSVESARSSRDRKRSSDLSQVSTSLFALNNSVSDAGEASRARKGGLASSAESASSTSSSERSKSSANRSVQQQETQNKRHEQPTQPAHARQLAGTSGFKQPVSGRNQLELATLAGSNCGMKAELKWRTATDEGDARETNKANSGNNKQRERQDEREQVDKQRGRAAARMVPRLGGGNSLQDPPDIRSQTGLERHAEDAQEDEEDEEDAAERLNGDRRLTGDRQLRCQLEWRTSAVSSGPASTSMGDGGSGGASMGASLSLAKIESQPGAATRPPPVGDSWSPKVSPAHGQLAVCAEPNRARRQLLNSLHTSAAILNSPSSSSFSTSSSSSSYVCLHSLELAANSCLSGSSCTCSSASTDSLFACQHLSDDNSGAGAALTTTLVAPELSSSLGGEERAVASASLATGNQQKHQRQPEPSRGSLTTLAESRLRLGAAPMTTSSSSAGGNFTSASGPNQPYGAGGSQRAGFCSSLQATRAKAKATCTTSTTNCSSGSRSSLSESFLCSAPVSVPSSASSASSSAEAASAASSSLATSSASLEVARVMSAIARSEVEAPSTRQSSAQLSSAYREAVASLQSVRPSCEADQQQQQQLATISECNGFVTGGSTNINSMNNINNINNSNSNNNNNNSNNNKMITSQQVATATGNGSDNPLA